MELGIGPKGNGRQQPCLLLDLGPALESGEKFVPGEGLVVLLDESACTHTPALATSMQFLQ